MPDGSFPGSQSDHLKLCLLAQSPEIIKTKKGVICTFVSSRASHGLTADIYLHQC